LSILNLTKNVALPKQIELGVIEPKDKLEIISLITFHELPTNKDMIARAIKLSNISIAHNAEKAMIGGPEFFMCTLEHVLMENGVKPLHAFVKKVVNEFVIDNKVVVYNTYEHIGWV